VGGGARVITNAGGVNPSAAAALLEMTQLHGTTLTPLPPRATTTSVGELNANGVTLDNMDDGSFTAIRDRVSSANAYYGAWPVVEALKGGAQIVVTGRCTDTGITLASMIHAFDWAPDDWDRSPPASPRDTSSSAARRARRHHRLAQHPRLRRHRYSVIEVFDGSFIVSSIAAPAAR
jgi:hypothetical protein